MWRELRREFRNLADLLAEKRCTFCAAPIRPGSLAPASARAARKLAGQGPAEQEPAGQTEPALSEPELVDCYGLRVCPECLSRLPRRSAGFCLRCGEPAVLAEMPGGVCGHCLRRPPPWGNIYFYGIYNGYLRELLLGLKFGGSLHLAEGLGRLLAGHPELAAANHSCIVPVPLHKTRLRERGFNQSALLARPLSKKLGIALKAPLLVRALPTRHQTGLTRELRRRNVSGSFTALPEAKGERILLVDDVLTTGATLAAAALCLLKAGAASVDVAVAARTAGRNMLSRTG